MKKILLLITSISILSTLCYAQSTTTGNLANGINFLGYTNNASPLWFRTNDGTGTRNRMIINNGLFGPNDGQISMGNDLPNNFQPSARLHLHQTGSNNFLRFTTPTTGINALDGLVFGMTNNGFAFITNFEPNQPTTFFTNNGTPNNVFMRMRIESQLNNGYIGMGDVLNVIPQSVLHLHQNGNTVTNTQWTNGVTGNGPTDGFLFELGK